LSATAMIQRASYLRMPRWCLPILFTVALGAVTVFAQFGGPRFPGMGGQRYPQGQQGQNPNSSQPKVYGPTETLTGSLQQISDSSLIIDAGEDRIILVKIQDGTKYLSTMGKVKFSDFEPGDHVTVEAVRDDNDHYFTKTVTMNKKGTAEDKSAAMKAASGSSGSGGSSGGDSGDSDPDRPRLHRSNPDGGSTGSDSSSSVPASTPASAPAADNSAPVRRPATSQPASTSSSDDSGPPVLHRSPSTSAASSSPNPQIASADTPSSARPSLSAEDVNGVTRVPVVPPTPSAGASGGSDTGLGDSEVVRRSGTYAGGGDPIIDQARDAAFTFSETLPNYVVKQLTNRYATSNSGRGRASWQALDVVTSDLIYEDGKERYTNVMINGKPTKYIEQTGSWSEGEFASMLQAILAPDTNADFRDQKQVTIMNRPSYRYDYTVAQPRSTWTLHADGQTVTPSYTGSIWVDKATYRVLRIEIAARNLPRDFPLDTAESSIDYDFVMIGEQKVLLPAQADSLSCSRGTPDCTKNHTEFHNYRKFSSDANITFEGAADK
jgi:hypothetical protein